MDEEHKEELRLEYLQEMREEPMRIWIEDNNGFIVEKFINSFPPEDQPLDDETPDFLDRYCDDLDEFSKQLYYNRCD